ncbi:pentapeptide repeat-containing protein [Micromonospora ureilytica]|uniref:pentapeptide repeat-containing protein n=1 Tax=Micromonospora ureilytica TaxID=709868 RepID=UPI002E105FA1|nr:pentapeptide repeat-containing protein [Micromonospora ureilytica]
MLERPRWYKRIKLVGFRWEKRTGRKARFLEKSEKPSKPRTYKPIHLATLLILAVVALAVTAVAAALMWDAAQVPVSVPNSPDLAVREAQLRVDVIRNILAVGAGAGGLIALFLALRRQYVKERVDHSDQEYKNRTAEDTKHDAAERRVTELYAKAAEQLGSEKAAVRLAAIYSLERVGQGNPEHRQTIINLVCAYLRMPYSPPTLDATVHVHDGLDEDQALRLNEREVRMAAQGVLSKHLEYFELEQELGFLPKGGPEFWAEMSVDLSGAVLEKFVFRNCAVRGLRLHRARFLNYAEFGGLFARGYTNLAYAKFYGPADFAGAIFDPVVTFASAEFFGPAKFNTMTAGELISFKDVQFDGPVRFEELKAAYVFFENCRAALKSADSHSFPPGYALVRHADSKYGFVEQLTGKSVDSADPRQSTDHKRLGPTSSVDAD